MSVMFNIQVSPDEVEVTLRALKYLREEGAAFVTIRENDTIVNLVDYIEAETGSR